MAQNMDGDDPRSATTFPQLVRAAAIAYGDDLAITLKGESIPDESLTFRELDEKSRTFARGLIARGAGKGSRIGFIFGNGPSFALMLAAITRIGAIAVPISTLIKSNELVRVLRQSDVSVLIVQRLFLGSDYVERLCDALPELRRGDDPDLRLSQTPYLRSIISSGDALPPTIRDMGYVTQAAASVSDELLFEVESEVHPTDQMIEIYTSGSMALPKGVKHSHGAIQSRARAIRSVRSVERGEEAPAFMPMFWVGGLMMTFVPGWQVGATTTCTERTLSNSRMAIGAVHTDDDLAAMGMVAPFWGLGMTETLGPYSYGDVVRAPGYPLAAPLDHVLEPFEVRVWSDGHAVADGEIGEIQVRGPELTSGLHKVERSAFFEPDGFYRTGDMGRVEGKRILFLGRNGDMIKTAGANVSPAEVEMELQRLEGVDSAYVVGLPDKERGQLLVAAIVPREGARLNFNEIELKLRNALSSYKVPRAYLAIDRDDIPLLHSNKIARRQFESLLAERLGRA